MNIFLCALCGEDFSFRTIKKAVTSSAAFRVKKGKDKSLTAEPQRSQRKQKLKCFSQRPLRLCVEDFAPT